MSPKLPPAAIRFAAASPNLPRRRFLEGSLLGAIAAASGTSLFSASALAASRATIGSTDLAPGLKLITGAGANVVALKADDGVLLVDGGLEQNSRALLKEAAGSAKVRVLFNTHWHPEQTGANERVSKMGATIVSHENTKLWLGRAIKVSWLPKPYGPLPEKMRPNKTTYTKDTLAFGNEQLEYAHLGQAHTDGDLCVYFKNANVLATGGVVSADGWPRIDYETGGWIGGLVGGYDRLLKIANDTTKVVPANGPVITRADLDAHRKMYFTIYERLVALLNKGMGPDEAVAAEPAKEFAAQWGDPNPFVANAFRSMWGHFAPDA